MCEREGISSDEDLFYLLFFHCISHVCDVLRCDCIILHAFFLSILFVVIKI